MRQCVYLAITLCLLALPALAEVTLEVPGGGSALEQNLRGRLDLQNEPCDARRWRVRRLFGRAEEEMRVALHAFGYYGATIDKRLTLDEACWRAHFSIDLGPRTTIRRRTIEIHGEARDDEALGPLLAELPLPEGAPLNHLEYEAIKDRLREFAAERGYLDFVLTRHELRIYPDQAAAEILLEADSGPRYRFGELNFSEQPLDEEFVRRLAGTEEGLPYASSELTALNRRLSDSGYFAQVEVRPRRSEAEDLAVPIDVLLKAAPRHAWRAGIGFATDTGPRASLRYDNRYLNPRGHRLESAISLSPVISGLTADYLIPGREPHRETFSFGAQLKHEETDTSTSDSALLTARQTLRSEGWTQIRFIELLHEQSSIGDEDVSSTLLMPGINLDRVKADDLLRTRRGYRVNLEARGAYEGIISTATLLQLSARAKGIYRFGEGGRVSARVNAGATWVQDINDLPASLRFFAGGDNSVRGYAYQSLGPTNDDGEVRGGKYLLTGSLEYEHPIVADDWWAAAFIDAGNAFDTDDVEMRLGVGLGLRWYSPVGRLRLDVAFPQDSEEDGWRLHFGLGADL